MTRSRTITWNDPVESAAYGHGLTGLEFLHRQTSGLIPAAPVADLIGLRGTYVMPGRVTFEYEPREEHYSSLGAVHGGIVTAVLDTAMCAAMQSVLDADVGLATVELRTTLRPAGDADHGRLPRRGHRRPRGLADRDRGGEARRPGRRPLRDRVLLGARAGGRAQAVARRPDGGIESRMAPTAWIHSRSRRAGSSSRAWTTSARSSAASCRRRRSPS